MSSNVTPDSITSELPAMPADAPSIVVLISGSGSNLQALLDAEAHNQLSGKIVAVISNEPDAYGLTRAHDAGIDAVVLPHREYDSREAYDGALIKVIERHQPDIIVLAGFMRILTGDFTRHYEGRMFNIHPSLLPKYKGINTHQRALDAGDTEHGVSVHFVTEELDGGPVVLQAKVPIFEGDTVDEVQARVHEQEHRIYPLVVNWFCQERLKLENGRVTLDGEVLGSQGYASE